MGKITEYKGDIFDSTADIICHQVNFHGVMGAGIAAQVRGKYPKVYEEYWELCIRKENPKELLGVVQAVETRDNSKWYIANCFCQNDYPDENGNLTNYETMEKCFNTLCQKTAKCLNVTVIAIPYGMGCGIAGGDWKIVRSIIERVFAESEIDVEIWRLV